MNKKLGIARCMLVSLCITIATSLCYGNELPNVAQTERPIKVYIKDFVNQSGQDNIVPGDFMKEVEKAFINRKSVSFAIAKTPQESNVEVSAIIKAYQYLEKDPVKPSLGFIMALDAVTSENFAEMSVEFTVTNPKNGNIMWKDLVTGFVKRTMTPQESIPAVYDKVARNFVAKAFGKGE